MEKAKLQEIIKSLEGINYLEWQKVKMAIDDCFRADISTQANKTVLASADRIIRDYRCTSTF